MTTYPSRLQALRDAVESRNWVLVELAMDSLARSLTDAMGTLVGTPTQTGCSAECSEMHTFTATCKMALKYRPPRCDHYNPRHSYGRCVEPSGHGPINNGANIYYAHRYEDNGSYGTLDTHEAVPAKIAEPPQSTFWRDHYKDTRDSQYRNSITIEMEALRKLGPMQYLNVTADAVASQEPPKTFKYPCGVMNCEGNLVDQGTFIPCEHRGAVDWNGYKKCMICYRDTGLPCRMLGSKSTDRNSPHYRRERLTKWDGYLPCDYCKAPTGNPCRNMLGSPYPDGVEKGDAKQWPHATRKLISDEKNQDSEKQGEATHQAPPVPTRPHSASDFSCADQGCWCKKTESTAHTSSDLIKYPCCVHCEHMIDLDGHLTTCYMCKQSESADLEVVQTNSESAASWTGPTDNRPCDGCEHCSHKPHASCLGCDIKDKQVDSNVTQFRWGCCEHCKWCGHFHYQSCFLCDVRKDRPWV